MDLNPNNSNETSITNKSKLISAINNSDNKKQQQQCESTINNNNNRKISHKSEKENHSSVNNQQDSNQQNQQQQEEEKICFECNKPLTKSRHLINIAGQENKSWHPECFKCNVCNNQLDREISCHIYKDKILCKDDYQKLQKDKSIKCSRCKWSISSLDWVQRAGDYIYHLACFSCDICCRQLSTGEQFTLNIDPEEKSNVRLLCRLHFAIENTSALVQSSSIHTSKPTSSSSISACSPLNPFKDRRRIQSINSAGRLSPMGQVSSSSAVFDVDNTCQEPQQSLTNNSNNNYNRASQEHFKQIHFSHFNNHADYIDMLQITGANNNSIASTTKNRDQLLMIDHTSSSNENIKSRYDRNDDNNQVGHNNSHNTVDDIRQHLISTGDTSFMDCTVVGGGRTSTSSSTNGSTNGHLIGMNQSKSKRVRTTFTEDQLSILQTHFQIDSNPDGQDLERIATITGLSKRVTQVWFQNSRARQKKYMIKRKPSSTTAAAAAVCPSRSINNNGGTVSGNSNNNHSLAKTSSFDNEQEQQRISHLNFNHETLQQIPISGVQDLPINNDQNRINDWSNQNRVLDRFKRIGSSNNSFIDELGGEDESSNSSSDLLDEEENELVITDEDDDDRSKSNNEIHS